VPSELISLQHPYPGQRTSYQIHGLHVVSASSNDTCEVQDAKTGRAIARFPHQGDVKRAVLSPDGKRILASMSAYSIVWDAVKGGEIARFWHNRLFSSNAFSPNGSRIVTLAADNTSVIWDALTDIEIAQLQHDGRVKSASFSPDGSRVIILTNDDTSIVWGCAYATQITGKQLVEAVCKKRLVGEHSFSADELRDSRVPNLPQDIVAACLQALADIEAREGASH
jgi:WD40 repeat protein